jgi:hypothetical protein
MRNIFDPETERRRRGLWRFLISDGFESHLSVDLLRFAKKRKILIVALPSHHSHLLQPLDVGLSSPLRRAYHSAVDKEAQLGVNHIDKLRFLRLLHSASSEAYTTSNILAAWSGSGIKPYDTERCQQLRRSRGLIYNFKG